MFIDHAQLRNTVRQPIAVKILEHNWCAAFAAYNSHNTGSRLSMALEPCYQKVLAYLMNNNITQI